jgi:alpha-D-ribose 1-methylphosphonate 5-triphosphate synthase subunit PhnL
MLRITGLRKAFTSHLRHGATRTVLNGIDLTVPAGSCTVLMGPSGCGKSSLLRCVHRSYRPDAGRVDLTTPTGTLDLAAAADREVLAVRRTTMAMVTQFLSVTPRISAADLVADQGVGETEARELLARLGLPDAIHDLPPATFSGGERQLVNLAIALARPRPLLLIDEATASLDTVRRDTVLRTLAALKQQGTTILAIFHDLPDTPGLVDQTIHLANGRPMENP